VIGFQTDFMKQGVVMNLIHCWCVSQIGCLKWSCKYWP